MQHSDGGLENMAPLAAWCQLLAESIHPISDSASGSLEHRQSDSCWVAPATCQAAHAGFHRQKK